jgi:hypothetical protein
MARILADENVPLPVVSELRRLGHDVETLAEAGKANQAFSDEAVLALGKTEDRAVLTLNRRHFIRLHQASCDHAGIVACTLDPDFVEQAARIHRVLESASELRGQLIRVNRPDR